MKKENLLSAGAVAIIIAALSSGAQTADAQPAANTMAPVVVHASAYAVSRPVSELARERAGETNAPSQPARMQPLRRLPKTIHSAGTTNTSARDGALQSNANAPWMPLPLMTFEGIINASNTSGYTPSDNNGDIGPSNYVEAVNTLLQVFNRAGQPLIGTFKMSTLFAPLGGPASLYDDGDPIVLYDQLANRWLISQFVITPWITSAGAVSCSQAIAISQTGNPLGSYYLYNFVMPGNKLNDYGKFGVWPDAYYMTDNQFGAPPSYTWAGGGAFAFEREKMLAGNPSATYIYFNLFPVNSSFSGLLPCDLDGPAPPSNSPALFAEVDDSTWIGPADALRIWKFTVDWVTPANSTFGLSGQPDYVLPVAAFDPDFSSYLAVPQPNTAVKLDVIADRLLYRLQYRNFGAYETLVANHTVDAGVDHAGVRFYELRRTLPAGTWAVYQQGTFAPDGENRWMGSAAMDGAGNLAIGYSVSSASVYPSIRYAGRLASDPTNTMAQGEAMLIAGAGSQTHSAGRWGDYSMLAVDPVDDSTFWYVNQYYLTTSSSSWRTRIGTFAFVPEPLALLPLLAVACVLLRRSAA